MAYSNKKVEKLRGLDFDDLRQMYRVFLVDSGLAKASIATAYTDTFPFGLYPVLEYCHHVLLDLPSLPLHGF